LLPLLDNIPFVDRPLCTSKSDRDSSAFISVS
jgi:hypothetical protein